MKAGTVPSVRVESRLEGTRGLAFAAMGRRWHLGARVTILALHALLIALSVLFLFPLAWMITGSFESPGELFAGIGRLVPDYVTLANYRFAFTAMPLLRNLLNSAFIASSFTFLALLFCSAAGFAFAKLRFPGRRVLFGLLLSTMMVPSLVGMVPLFLIMARLGWVDTYQSVIIPGAADAFGIFFMRQYISTLPDALLDAARIDGCSDLRIYADIIVPSIRPALVALAIMEFMGSWNGFLWPLIVLRSLSKYTIVLAVASLPGAKFNTPWGAVLAGTTFAVTPLIIVFAMLQKYLITGMSWAGLKQ